MKNLFTALPKNLESEVFETLVKHEHVQIERIISNGQSSPESGWYDQETHEWVVVLKGEAKLGFVSGAELHLQAGDYINIPAHTRHRVNWTPQDTETIWLAIHY